MQVCVEVSLVTINFVTKNSVILKKENLKYRITLIVYDMSIIIQSLSTSEIFASAIVAGIGIAAFWFYSNKAL
jgi:hypothetical protein